jgi:hypothetical protein
VIKLSQYVLEVLRKDKEFDLYRGRSGDDTSRIPCQERPDSSPLLYPCNLVSFGLKNSPNLARLIALNLNRAIFDRSATAAGNPDFFGRLFNHGNGQVCREFINDDHRLATAMGAFSTQNDAAQLPKRLTDVWRLFRPRREVRQVYFYRPQMSERLLFGVGVYPLFGFRHGIEQSAVRKVAEATSDARGKNGQGTVDR